LNTYLKEKADMSQSNPDEKMGDKIFGQEYDVLQEGLKKLREKVVEKQSGVKDAEAQLG
jgi:hypothetical protein